MAIDDFVSISDQSAEAFNRLGLGDFYTIMPARDMAFLAIILPMLDDRPEWFPKGKWATIQHIQQQITDISEKISNHINVSARLEDGNSEKK
jgi:hypothetical protein